MKPLTTRWVHHLLLGYPLAVIFALLPAGALRHAYSLVTGVFLAQFVLGNGWIHSLVSSTIVYFIIAATSGIRALDKHRHIIVFVFMMSYMTASHIYRLYVDYMGWTLDFTGPQMLLTIKLTSLAYSLCSPSCRWYSFMSATNLTTTFRSVLQSTARTAGWPPKLTSAPSR